MTDKAVSVLRSKLKDFESLPFRDVEPWIDSIREAIIVLERHQAIEKDLDDMYKDYLGK